MTNEQQRSPIFCLDKLKKHLYNSIWGIKQLLMKRRNLKYGHLPPKTVILSPWECLCVDLIGPYTLKGKDNLQIDFMALTMIDPASSWFEIAELPVVK